ncbi:hypothetical protein GYMLUDRAFT_264935 [Collybiopsis luxurians FD-317 M1]|uniref:Uncharacterized protein n=1 Tax=Collybiopsis luxurians FD-317 M1 TaxID=944289 RepID=A0A0D0ATQ9_9AGAR|nr:hypothetical protein GYMLUDRAFT_264935 [Collybiopsis luxurians FD-317 M1]
MIPFESQGRRSTHLHSFGFCFTLILTWISLLASTTNGLTVHAPISATALVPVTVTWTLSNGDPTLFGLVEKDIDNSATVSIVPVDAGGESSGLATLTFPTAGEYVIQPIQQQSLEPGETASSIGGAPQIEIVKQSDPNGVGQPSIPFISITISPTSTSTSTQSSSITPSSITLPAQISTVSTTSQTLPSSSPSSSLSSKGSTLTGPDTATSTTPTLSTTSSSNQNIPAPLPTTTTNPLITLPSSTATAVPSSSAGSPGRSSHKGGLSHTAKKAIILAVTGTAVVGGTALVMCLRRKRFFKQRKQLEAFRQRLARIPGLQALGGRPDSLGSERSESYRSIESGRITSTTMSETTRAYPFAGSRSSVRSGRVLF